METSSRRIATWIVHPQLPHEQFQEARDASIDSILAQLLHNRGLVTIAEMQDFVKADYTKLRDPLTLIDMPKAVLRIQQALENKEHITVYGDYDADGVTSSALLFRALRTLKQHSAILDFHIPHRLRDGCGLNLTAIDGLKARGTQLIITTDCASSDVEQVAYANSLGIDVIITDHHHPPAERPEAYAMVNPWRPDCGYGERYLCGVGIAFKLTQALYRAAQRSLEDEKELLDLVAIGTIADIAPLLGENHTLVRLGMQQLNQTRKPGLQALIRNANLQQGHIRERDIAFGLGPRINAAGRMKEARIAFELMVTDDQEEATAHAQELEQLNILRQQQTEELMHHVREQAENQPTKPVILVHGDDWHEGIIGLVAGKMAEEIHKPVLVLSNDPQTQLSRGSARSQKDFNIIEALRRFEDRLERYGGHTQAAGFTIKSERIAELHEHLTRWQENGGETELPILEGTALPDQTGIVTEQESPNVDGSQDTSANMVDLVFTRLDRLTYSTYKLLRQLSPFGAGNPEPVFKMERLHLLDKWTSGVQKQNLRLRLAQYSQGGSDKEQKRRSISDEKLAHFNNQKKSGDIVLGTYTRGAAEIQRLEQVSHVDIIFRLQSSEDENKPEVWLKILNVEPSEA